MQEIVKLNSSTAETELRRAGMLNPGQWVDHSRFVAQACRNIAAQCADLSAEKAYCFGLLHDIGRYAGVTSEKHLIDGYRFCMKRNKKQEKSHFRRRRKRYEQSDELFDFLYGTV